MSQPRGSRKGTPSVPRKNDAQPETTGNFESLRKRLLDTLDNQSAINIQMNFWFDEMMKHHEVNYSIYRIVRFLRKYPGGVEPSVIADRLTLLRQTVTNMVDDLEKKRIVLRTPHPNDRRRIYVVLTDEGALLANKLTDEMTSLQDEVLLKFSRKEMEAYLDIRTRIIQYTESAIKMRYFSESE